MLLQSASGYYEDDDRKAKLEPWKYGRHGSEIADSQAENWGFSRPKQEHAGVLMRKLRKEKVRCVAYVKQVPYPRDEERTIGIRIH